MQIRHDRWFNPLIIQGGMGVSVSNWRLARAVSLCGQLGVVSGTFLDKVIARRLQDGDPDSSIRRALSHFPVQEIAQTLIDRYYIPGGKPGNKPYRTVAKHSLNSPQRLIDLTVAANFVEVFLAKEGHDGLIGINYLTKIDLPTLPSLYGAMLAGVDCVLMGAGIPKAIPGIINQLSQHQTANLRVDVEGAGPEEKYELVFHPCHYALETTGHLKRPRFFAIVSSHTLAQSLARKASGPIDGFIVEHHSAGGHNAPPREAPRVGENGESLYGTKDETDIAVIRKLNIPFWLAGSSASPEKLQEARREGAAGVQIGTAFAYCEESGMDGRYKKQVITNVLAGTAKVVTDPRVSSSGYPFKVVDLPGTLSRQEVFAGRKRVCDLGYLSTAYKTARGSVGFRCPGEPSESYLRKGGKPEETEGRKCLCNGLMATIGQPQIRDDYTEPALITAGSDMNCIKLFVDKKTLSYSASDVVNTLLRDYSDLIPERGSGGSIVP